MHIPISVFWIEANEPSFSQTYKLLRQIVALDLGHVEPRHDLSTLHFSSFRDPAFWAFLDRKHAAEAVWINFRLFSDAASIFLNHGIPVVGLDSFRHLRLASEFVEVVVNRQTMVRTATAAAPDGPRAHLIPAVRLPFACITVPMLASLLGRVVFRLGSSFRSIAVSHFWCLMSQTVLPLSRRRIKANAASAGEKSLQFETSAKAAEFKSYHAEFCTELLGSFGAEEPADQEEQYHLYGADLWDGRLLHAIHQYRCRASAELPSQEMLSQFPGTLQEEIVSSSECHHLLSLDGWASQASMEIEIAIPSVGARMQARAVSADFKKPKMIRGLLADAFWKFSSEKHSATAGMSFDAGANPTGGMQARWNRQDGHSHSNLPIKTDFAYGNVHAPSPEGAQHRIMERGYEHTGETQLTETTEESEAMAPKELSDKQMRDSEEIGQANLRARRAGTGAFAAGEPQADWQKPDCPGILEDGAKLRLLQNARVVVDYPKVAVWEPTIREHYGLRCDGERDTWQQPEAWQLQMLAGINERKSLLVVAPTSSGKTMSAEFAMRLSVRKGGGTIAVFVQPTNALVRQTYSDLAAQFGHSTVGMFTREHRQNVSDGRLNCRVLVTNAQCLEILLMSGDNLLPRIDYLVIDEIHEIDVIPNGTYLERLLNFTASYKPAIPIIGLSATLANIDEFHSWLCDIKGGPGSVELIEHKQRSTTLVFNKLDFQAGVTTSDEGCIPPMASTSINPLLLLSEIDCTSDQKLAEFMESVPQLQKGQLLAMFQSLHAKFKAGSRASWTPAWLSRPPAAGAPPLLVRQASLPTATQLATVGREVFGGAIGRALAPHPSRRHSLGRSPLDRVFTGPAQLAPQVAEQEQQAALQVVVDRRGGIAATWSRSRWARQRDQSHAAALTWPEMVPTGVKAKYAALVALFEPDSELTDPHDKANYVVAQSACWNALRKEVLAQAALSCRVWCDAAIAGALHSSGHDWYGGLYLESATVPPPLDEFLTPRKRVQLFGELRHNCATRLLQRATAPFGIFGGCEIRRTVLSAADSSLKYVLHLLVKHSSDDPEHQVSAEVKEALATVASQCRFFGNGAGEDSEDQEPPTATGFENLKHKVAATVKHLWNQPRGPSPTLIFMFNKNNIKRLVEHLMLEDVLEQWYAGDRGQFIREQSTVDSIAELPQTTSDLRIEALFYGIGIHSSSGKESAEYLALVEQMFRRSELRYVFATGSLSFGINMPCENVVFAGTSPHLNGLMFWQCSGRAGRRGYGDGVGNIYFLDFPDQAIKRRLCSPLERLSPQCPITPAFMLRASTCCAQYQGSAGEHTNVGQVLGMLMKTLTNPLFEKLIKGERELRLFNDALAHSVIFGWSFLNERGYLRPDGTPTIKADVPLRLHYCYNIWVMAELMEGLTDDEACEAAGPGDAGLCALAAACARSANGRDDELELQLLRTLMCIVTYSETGNKSRGAASGIDTTLADPVPPAVLRLWKQHNADVQVRPPPLTHSHITSHYHTLTTCHGRYGTCRHISCATCSSRP
jgi:hypothetical protein